MRASWLFSLSEAPAESAPLRYVRTKTAAKQVCDKLSQHWCSRTSGVAVTRTSVRTVRHKIARQCPGRDADGCSPVLLMLSHSFTGTLADNSQQNVQHVLKARLARKESERHRQTPRARIFSELLLLQLNMQYTLAGPNGMAWHAMQVSHACAGSPSQPCMHVSGSDKRCIQANE